MQTLRSFLIEGELSHDIMVRLPDHLKALGQPFLMVDLLLFEAILEEYISDSRSLDISEFISFDNALALRAAKRTGSISIDQFDFYFSTLTGAYPGPSVQHDERAKERYRHASSVIMTIGCFS